jgi:hypothetical protein
MLVSSSDGFWREALFAAILLSALAMVAVVVVKFKMGVGNFKKFLEMVVGVRLRVGSRSKG